MPYTPMQLAEAFLKTGELSDAWDALTQQLADDPQDDEAKRLRAMVGLRLGADYLAQALADQQSIIAMTHEDWFNQSVTLEKMGRLDEALTILQSAHQQFPDEERLTERLLTLLLNQQAYAECLSLIRQQKPSWRWFEREGDVLVLSGDDMMATARYGLALAQLESFAETMRPDYLASLKARLLLARAHAYRRLEHLELSRQHYLEAQTLLPDDPSIQFNLGLLCLLEGDANRAYEICKEALVSAPAILAESMRSSLQETPAYEPLKVLLL